MSLTFVRMRGHRDALRWTEAEVKSLATIGPRERGAIRTFAEATGRTYGSVYSKLTTLRICGIASDVTHQCYRYNNRSLVASAWENPESGSYEVPTVEPEQEKSISYLVEAIRQLHPAVQRFCFGILDGATTGEALEEAGLNARHLSFLLPRLRQFLAPHLQRAA